MRTHIYTHQRTPLIMDGLSEGGQRGDLKKVRRACDGKFILPASSTQNGAEEHGKGGA